MQATRSRGCLPAWEGDPFGPAFSFSWVPRKPGDRPEALSHRVADGNRGCGQRHLLEATRLYDASGK